MSKKNGAIKMSMQQQNRSGENGPVPGRCDRFYLFQSEWFFTTREGSPVGPYDTHESAQSGLQNYLDFLALAKPKVRARLINAMTKKDITIN